MLLDWRNGSVHERVTLHVLRSVATNDLERSCSLLLPEEPDQGDFYQLVDRSDWDNPVTAHQPPHDIQRNCQRNIADQHSPYRPPSVLEARQVEQRDQAEVAKAVEDEQHSNVGIGDCPAKMDRRRNHCQENDDVSSG